MFKVKKYWYFFVLGFLVLILLILKILAQPAPPQPMTENLSPTPSISSFEPSSFPRRIFPTSTDLADESWPISTASSSKNPSKEITKEYFPEVDYNQLIEEFGDPEGEFFGPDAGAGFSVLVFPKAGVATVADPDTDKVLEIWYFEPTSLGNFYYLFGENLSVSRPQDF